MCVLQNILYLLYDNYSVIMLLSLHYWMHMAKKYS